MIEAVRKHGGHVVQSMGDGIFALFGAPIAHEDHPQRAIHAALAMQQALGQHAAKLRAEARPSFEARIGVNTGEVVIREILTGGHPEYTPIGHTANLAARLQTIARPGSIAISEQTRLLVEGYFELQPLGPMEVKGLSAPVETYDVIGPGPLQGHFQVAVKRGLATFVGRQREMEEIARALELVRMGQGQILAVIGEPGVGKSRLLYEFKQAQPANCLTLEAAALSHGAAAPYHVVIELLRDYFRFLPGDTQQQRWEKVEKRVAGHGLQDTLPYLCTLLALPWETIAQESDPNLRRRRTIDAVKRLLLMESRNQPLLLVCEDLHWLDRESLQFLSAMSSSIASARVLGLVSFRPEFRHEFGNRSYYRQIHLNPLDSEEAGQMLQSQLGHHTVLRELQQFVLTKSEGNPFFIEELLQTLFDQGVLSRSDTNKLIRPLTEVTIPATVQGILASRIDRLPAEQKELLETMAVIGRRSSLSLLKQVVSWPDNQLDRMLADLQFLEFVHEQPTAVGSEYVLKHGLTQDVAYASLLRERRAALHERVAQAVESLYAERPDDHLDELAHHYTRSGNTTKAVEYLQLAGRQALIRSGLTNGISYLTQALELLETLGQSGKPAKQELEVRLLLGPALMASEGYASPKVEQVYSRAREVCQTLGDSSRLCAVLYGLFGIYNTRAIYETANELALEMVRLADNLQDPVFLVLASFAAGQTQFLVGEPGRCRNQFKRTAEFYSRERQRELTLVAGFDCGIAAMVWDSVAAWMLGYPDQALSRVDAAAALAREFGHPHTLTYTLSFRSWLLHFRRDWGAALAEAQTVLALADEHGLPLWKLWATTLGGSAMVEGGPAHKGREQITHGLEAVSAAGARITISQTLGLMGQAHARCGDPRQGLAAIEEALAAAGTSGERYYLAELNRLRGEMLLMLQPSNNALVEQCFRNSIDLARAQEARSWELRATTSLARLMNKQGHRVEAHRMLAEIYGRFTEGFETADLRDAKTLLEELGI
jgi:predicted ATPase